jgi:formamidopyrimidine-DNA glycosylase
MPELPEIAAYLDGLERYVVGRTLERVRVSSPSLLRTYDPPVSELNGKRLDAVSRLGKRVVLELEDDLFAVIHLMISGRLKWVEAGKAVPRKVGHAAFDFANGTLLLTEQATQKRASLHVVRGRDALAELGRGGVEPLEVSFETFRDALLRENRTLKRAMTDPRILSGVGNAHSDEILWEAQLSPVRLTRQLSEAELQRLYEVTRASLTEWVDRLRNEFKDKFPDKITAFHPAMKVHGRFGKPCERCGTQVQRIKYASNETNYCPTCQTGGKLLADRALSRLLGADWPKTLEELEERKETERIK